MIGFSIMMWFVSFVILMVAVAFLIKSSMAIVYVLVILLAVIVVFAIWFVFIQKRYMI